VVDCDPYGIWLGLMCFSSTRLGSHASLFRLAGTLSLSLMQPERRSEYPLGAAWRREALPGFDSRRARPAHFTNGRLVGRYPERAARTAREPSDSTIGEVLDYHTPYAASGSTCMRQLQKDSKYGARRRDLATRYPDKRLPNCCNACG